MARKTKPLTNTEVKQSKPKDKEYSLYDGDGLALRIKPNGTKTWIFNYSRPYTKKRANLSFGPYPDISLATARKRRLESRGDLAQDIDPKEKRDRISDDEKTAAENTLEKVAADWLEIKRETVSQDHAGDIWRSLELHIFPSLGKVPLHKLTAPQTIRILKPVEAKGSLEMVKRLTQRLNEVMDFAINSGTIETNPLSGIKKVFLPPKKNHLPSLKPDQLPELMKSIADASIKITTRCLIEWQLHTMVRPSEAAGTRWEEIDLEAEVWNIPADRMKKKKPHTVPLSPQVIALLEVIRPISGHLEHVFPADRNPRNHTHPETANMAIKRMGYEGKLVAHGLRSIASTTLNEQGFDPDLVETALAHVDKNETRSAYNHAEYLQRRAVMMRWWSEHIEQASMGSMSLATQTKHLRVVGEHK